jgi:hypothetical protein
LSGDDERPDPVHAQLGAQRARRGDAVSGAHFNPVVSAAMAWRGELARA